MDADIRAVMTTDPFTLCDALVDDISRMRPIFATFTGVSGYDAGWDDLSPAGVTAFAAEVSAWRDRVLALPPQSDRWSALAVHVMGDWLGRELDGFAHRDHERTLNTIDSS